METVRTAHGSPETSRLVCEGMPCFTVITRPRRSGDKVTYYCETAHAAFDPFAIEECERKPKRLKLKKVRFGDLSW